MKQLYQLTLCFLFVPLELCLGSVATEGGIGSIGK